MPSHRRAVPASACALLLALGALTGCADTGSTGATSVPGEPGGAKLQARWWSWAASEPTGTNPVADRTGAQCWRGQPGDVWFLAGSFGETVRRRCTAPGGRSLVFPVVNRFGDAADCDEFMAAAVGRVSRDGAPVATQKLAAAPITIDGVDGNPVTGTGRPVRVDACGIWATVAPMPAGDHVVVIDGSSGDFALHVEYLLTVV